jgi:uncharacterized protein
MKISILRFLLLPAVLAFGVIAVAQAEDLAAIKARITQRLATLDAFKAKGLIGENNRGLVELRGGGPEAGDVVAAENRDRGVVYAAIAQQAGSSAETVGRARAKQIAAASAAGIWLQRENNEWYKK